MQPTAPTAPVTRVEIADHLGDVFGGSPLRSSDVFDAARDSGARAEVLDVLTRLPEQRYHKLADLWPVLPEVPVEL